MIKLRAWYKPTKIMYQVVEIDWSKMLVDLNRGVIARPFSDVIVEQYAGLKDVNGKEIYEGDILRTKGGPIQIVKEGLLMIDREDLISGFYADNLSDGEPHTFSYDDEVIGDIHRNADLLGRNE